MYVSPYALWRTNLYMKTQAKAMYPFAAASVSLFHQYGIFITPRLFSSDSSIPNKKRFQDFILTESVQEGAEIILSTDSIRQLVDSFWREVFTQNKDAHILLQLRIKSGGTYYSLSKYQTVSFMDTDKLTEVFITRLHMIYERYTQFPITKIFLRYTILPTDSPLNRTELSTGVRDNSHLESLSAINLPMSLDLNVWGKVSRVNPTLSLIRRNGQTITVQTTANVRTISILAEQDDAEVINFTDTITSLENDEFTRTLDNGKIIFYSRGSQIRVILPQKEGVFIEGVPKAEEHKFNSITLDLETQRLPDNNLRVISAVFYDGMSYSTYFINDYATSDDMIATMLRDLITDPSHADSTVYVHNLSGFDGMFLLKSIALHVAGFKIIMKDSKIICITVEHQISKDNKIKIKFKDSLSLLPSSLAKLGKAFGVEIKGEFVHSRSDSCTTPYEFEQIRAELIAYNKQDCLVLYQVLAKFSELVFDMFQVNTDDVPTIASLAMLIYRSNFMPISAQIGITDVNLYDKLHAAYTGGAVDVFTPETISGLPVYCYDVNSLYPAVMRDMDFPVGNPTFIEGSVDLNSADTFGFLRVRVTCPANLHVPLLQTKLNGRTVAPVGT